MPCRLPTDAPYYRSSRSSVPSKAASLLLGVSFSRKLETIIPNSMLELNLIVYEWRGMSAKSKRQAIQRIGDRYHRRFRMSQAKVPNLNKTIRFGD